MNDCLSIKVKCPHCQTSLMDEETIIDNNPGIKLKINIAGKRGNIWLSSKYESYIHESDINIPENEIAELFCPHCNKSLIVEKKCEICNSPMATVNLFEGGKVTICAKAGCKKHYLTINDLTTVLNHFYSCYH